MNIAWRRWIGVGIVATGGCFDPGEAVLDTGSSDGSSGSTTASATSAPTVEPATATDPDPDTATEPDPDTATEPDPTTSPPIECDGDGPDPTCPAEAPFCRDGACVDCMGAAEDACAGLDPAAPICEAGTCAACTEHDQCSTGACRFTTGECFPASNLLWVDNTFGGCAGGVGSEASPLCEVEEAMGILNAQAGMEPWAIIVAGSPNSYEGSIDPGQNRPVAIVGPSVGLAATLSSGGTTIDLWAQSPETYLHRLTIDGPGGQPTIRCNTGQVFVTDSNLEGGSTTASITGCTMRLRRVYVHTNGMGLVVTGGQLVTDDVAIDNSSGGLRIEGGSAELRRTVVSNNYVEGGIHVQGSGDLQLINSMVFYNQYQNDGLNVISGGSAEVVHSTIVGALSCNDMAGPITVRNSIVLGHEFEAGMACTQATVHASVINQGLGQGMGNVMADADDLGSLFIDPSPGMGADYHLLPGSIAEGVAVHQAGDPIVDFDLDPRPMMVGAPDFAGADVP